MYILFVLLIKSNHIAGKYFKVRDSYRSVNKIQETIFIKINQLIKYFFLLSVAAVHVLVF